MPTIDYSSAKPILLSSHSLNASDCAQVRQACNAAALLLACVHQIADLRRGQSKALCRRFTVKTFQNTPMATSVM